MVRLSVRAIRVADGAADRPEMVGIGPAVKSAAEAFLGADQELLRKEVELPEANEEAAVALKRLGRVYDSVRVTVISRLDPPQKYFSASAFNVPDDLVAVSGFLKSFLEFQASLDWCRKELEILGPALREAAVKLARRNQLVRAVQKLQNKRQELFARMEYVLVRFRKVVRIIFGRTSKEYLCLKHGGKPGRTGDVPPENSEVPIEQSESASLPSNGAP